jgi:hypothetical protein
MLGSVMEKINRPTAKLAGLYLLILHVRPC